MRHLHTPLIDKLREHYDKAEFSFHVPGHKFGKLMPSKDWAHNLLTLDATELTGLDDLHDATDVIKEAQALTASFYGADKSYFLINGTTVGNLAMILTTCKPDAKVLVQRNCHKSIMNGIQLAGARPVMLSPEMDRETGIATGITLDQVKEAFLHDQHIDAVILTNPNYYGMTKDLRDIISFIHKRNVPVLIDEAHGAHFSIGTPFPPSSLSMGADIVVQSAHKTLPAMTMASFLHVKTERIDVELLEENLQILQSSSPSYVLMASLDYARSYIESLEEQDIKHILERIEIVKQRLNRIPQIKVIQHTNESDWFDPLKLIIQSKTSLSGFEMQAIFEEEGIYSELADPYNVLFIFPLAPLERIEELASLIAHTLSSYETVEREIVTFDRFPSITELALTDKELKASKTKKCPLEEAVDEISAETIVPYPPGIPIIMKGEKITESHVKYCHFLLQKGARFQGTDLKDIHVVETQQETRR
ncbi:aminotransferase class I/II-fold pyridoxal phosphate-dependent enzyme [Bacillus sp. Marseille-Q3570]|uniref:aminotransferase class I/II-fold pyridoxal phosphate-dependent enzyme n=1 Tax=Bacillus sp. Marseille-Q3570 TaxID=2963522 RepID=UPI0021B83A7A|nr:aminotransferase class I/II-fold pyridoxal phosphate-dependent enzyme [Bacillus sp. Marseille-Q3570]